MGHEDRKAQLKEAATPRIRCRRFCYTLLGNIQGGIVRIALLCLLATSRRQSRYRPRRLAHHPQIATVSSCASV